MYKFESLAFPNLFLSIDGPKIAKDIYHVTKSTWKITNDGLVNVYNNNLLSVQVVKSGQYVKICEGNSCIDAYDNTNRVEFYRLNNNKNQLWIMTSGDPVTPDSKYIFSLWSPSTQIKQLQIQDYTGEYRQRLHHTKVFYLKNVINPLHIPAYVTHIPAIDVNGDRSVILPNGKKISPLTLDKIS